MYVMHSLLWSQAPKVPEGYCDGGELINEGNVGIQLPMELDDTSPVCAELNELKSRVPKLEAALDDRNVRIKAGNEKIAQRDAEIKTTKQMAEKAFAAFAFVFCILFTKICVSKNPSLLLEFLVQRLLTSLRLKRHRRLKLLLRPQFRLIAPLRTWRTQ